MMISRIIHINTLSVIYVNDMNALQKQMKLTTQWLASAQ